MSPSGPERVREAIAELKLTARVVDLPDSARTAAEAAAALGCTVAEIAKSLVFRGRETGTAVVAVMSGVNRVDVRRLGALAGEPVEKADADFVRHATGYAIGGVPPFGYPEALKAFLDEDLLGFDTVWAAAGGPHSVFEVVPVDLRMAMGVEPVGLKLQ